MVFASAREFVRVTVALAAAMALLAATPKSCGQACGVQPGFEPGLTYSTTSYSPSSITSMDVHDDGTGPALYVAEDNYGPLAGFGSRTANLPATGLARLRNGRWERVPGYAGLARLVRSLDLGANLPGGPQLYVWGGDQPGQGGVSTIGLLRWDGSAWHTVQSVSITGVSIAAFDDGLGGGRQLYVATDRGSGNDVQRWNGHQWQTLPMMGHYDSQGVFSIVDDGSGPRLYLGGIDSNDQQVVSKLRRWNGAQMEVVEVPPGIEPIESVEGILGPDGPELVACGSFTINGQATSLATRKPDGTWVNLHVPPQPQGTYRFPIHMRKVHELDQDLVYVLGALSHPGSQAVNGYYRYDGVSVTEPMSTYVGLAAQTGYAYSRDVTVFDDGRGPALWVGGWLGGAAQPSATPTIIPANGVFRVPLTGNDAGRPHAIGKGIESWAGSTGASNPRLLVQNIHYQGRDQLAISGPVFAVDGRPAQQLVLFDGQHWTVQPAPSAWAYSYLPLGVGVQIANGAERLVFGQSGFGGVSYLSNDGAVLVSVGQPGLPAFVSALVNFDDGTSGGPTLYALGAGVWRLVEGGWQRISSAYTPSFVVGDLGQGSRLFASMSFADGPGVGVWNGTSWTRLGPAGGFASVPTSLVVHDDGAGPHLYAGFESTGTFGGVAAARIAKFDGSGWQPLGAGLTGGRNAVPLALASFDDGTGPALYAAGDFATAGGVACRGFARWRSGRWEPYLDINQRSVDGYSLSTLNLNVLGDTLYLTGFFADTGLRPAGAPTNTESNVIQAANILAIRACPPACFPDLNNDGVTDQTDVDYLINAAAGGDNPTHANLDLNNDGVIDQGDVDVLINVIAGAPCQ
ncbi:MAG: hypothetical protein GC200_11465 [Tepidisphaera sp.]|nr:hypothetical protein [Tepidisphaera sp.]